MINTNNKFLLVILFILLLIPISSAVNLSYEGYMGTLGSIVTNSYTLCSPDDQHRGAEFGFINGIKIFNIENSQEPYSLISYASFSWVTMPLTSDYKEVNFYIDNTYIGRGAIGYNRLPSYYQFFVYFFEWNAVGYTGNKVIHFVPTASVPTYNVFAMAQNAFISTRVQPANSASITIYQASYYDYQMVQSTGGVYGIPASIYNKYSRFTNYWKIETVSDYFTRANVTKSYGGFNYTSQVYIQSKNNLVGYESATGILPYLGTFTETPISVHILDIYGRWWNTSSYYVTDLGFSLSVSPDEILKGSSSRISITSDTTIDAVDYIFLWDLTTKDTTNIGKFKRLSGSWYLYSESTGTYLSTSLNPTDYLYTPTTSGLHTIKAGIYTGTKSFDVTDTLTVNEGTGLTSPVEISINAFDASTNAYLINYQLSIKDADKEIWYNFSNIELTKVLTFNAGTNLFGYVTKENYYLGSSNYTVPNLPNQSFGTFWSIFLYPLSLPMGNTTLTVEVQNYLYNPLPNSIIRLSDGQSKSNGNNADLVSFILAKNTPYTITVSSTGYGTQIETINTSSLVAIKKVYRLGYPVTPTSTVSIVRTYPSPTPRITVTGGVVINGTFVKSPTNLIETLDYMICTQVGICDKTTLDLTKAFLLIGVLTFGLVYIGRNSDNVGMLAMIGSTIGFVISVALGFIPLWLLLAALGLGLVVVIILRGV